MLAIEQLEGGRGPWRPGRDLVSAAESSARQTPAHGEQLDGNLQHGPFQEPSRRTVTQQPNKAMEPAGRLSRETATAAAQQVEVRPLSIAARPAAHRQPLSGFRCGDGDGVEEWRRPWAVQARSASNQLARASRENRLACCRGGLRVANLWGGGCGPALLKSGRPWVTSAAIARARVGGARHEARRVRRVLGPGAAPVRSPGRDGRPGRPQQRRRRGPPSGRRRNRERGIRGNQRELLHDKARSKPGTSPPPPSAGCALSSIAARLLGCCS